MTNTIFIIEDPQNVDAIIEDIKNHEDAKVYSLNYFTHRILENKKVPHDIGEDLLTEVDYKKIDNDFINATINWNKNEITGKLLVFDGIDLPGLIELELSQYFLPIYRSATAIMRIIEKEKPQTVICSTYLNDFTERICKSNNIQVVSITEIKQPALQYDNINVKFNLRTLPISFTMSRKSYLQMKEIFEKIVHFVFRLDANTKLKERKCVLLLDFNPIQYNTLLHELSSLDANILLLNHRRPAIWNMQSLKIVKNSGCKIVDLTKFEAKIRNKIDDRLGEFTKKVGEVWQHDEIFEKLFCINSQTFWYSIKESFVKICNSRFEESTKRIMLLKEFFEECDISVILEWAELGQEEKEVLNLVKQRGIKTVMLQHAMYPTSKYWDAYGRFLLFFSYPLMSEKQAVWGELTRKQAQSYGLNHNIVVTGNPKHDDFFHLPKKTENKGVILFATTQVSGINAEYSTTRAYLKFDNFVREVCRVAKLFPNKKLIVKPHPAPDFINNVTELIKEIDPNIIISHTTNIKELISNCEVLITFNNSTIALDSIVLGKPTISLQIEKWAEENEIVKMNAVLSITNIKEIENGLKKLLYDNEFKNKIQDNAKKFVEMYLSNRGSASKSLAEVLDKS
jgi:hypothetical protein